MNSDLIRNRVMDIQHEDFFVDAGGHRLAVRRLLPAALNVAAAEGSAPILVFLHEGLGSIAQWREFPAALCAASGLDGLVYDRCGFGASEAVTLPRPDDYLRREAEEALPGLLASCGIAKPILVGHSDGGTIALLYAAAFPQDATACIAESAHVFVEDVAIAGIQAAVHAWQTTDLKSRLAAYHGAQTETVFVGWSETWLRPSFRHWRITDTLATITCPLLVVQGANDEYGTRAQVDAIAAGVSGPAESLLVPNCGHVPHHQQRDVVLAAMNEFINRITRA